MLFRLSRLPSLFHMVSFDHAREDSPSGYDQHYEQESESYDEEPGGIMQIDKTLVTTAQ
jgi:hypothetical protein